jgi:hypothetical protein
MSEKVEMILECPGCNRNVFVSVRINGLSSVLLFGMYPKGVMGAGRSLA